VKVLITGGSGQVGHAVLQTAPAGYEIVAPDSQTLDLADLTRLHSSLCDICPDALINAAAYTAVDKAETENAIAERINAESVEVIARYCQTHSIPMIQVSTDYVFDGEQKRPYVVTDSPNPLSIYGKTKLAGELATARICPAAYIVRSGWIYSEHGNNFVKTMLRLAAEGKPLRVVDDQRGSPTYARNLAKFLWQVLEQRPDNHLMHCSDAGQLSWYQFALAAFAEARNMGLLHEQPDIKPCRTADYGSQAPRPAYSVLECAPDFATLGLQQIDGRVALRAMLARLPQHPLDW
jgi:dTDP-4-dehydrorhamnose reductase